MGESVWQALVRELEEELGIHATEGGPWFQIEHHYEHANVRLHLYKVWSFEGAPKSLEQQRFTWASLNCSNLSPILPATEPWLPKLVQPALMALSNYESGFDDCANRFEFVLRNTRVPMYIQFREKKLKGEALFKAFQHCYSLCQETGQSMLLNSTTWLNLKPYFGSPPCPLHLTELHMLSGQFSELTCAGASVHSAESLKAAFECGLSYAVLGSVNQTPSHPGQSGIGWVGFHDLVLEARLPVYAIGGLNYSDIFEARKQGAHGIAMLSQFNAPVMCENL